MKYYIIAGEASGDLHGSNMIRALKQQDPEADIRCWGGDLMQAAGGNVVKHYRDLAFMGFVEVIRHLGTIMGNIRFCKNDIASFKPDVVVFIDYPGFNMRIAQWAKLQGYKTAYYISPTVWAWKEKRVHHIHKYVDEMMVILPFEKAYYDKYGYKVSYVGHPLMEVMKKEEMKPSTLEKSAGKKIIALLPGSRTQEIRKLLPIMLECVAKYADCECIIAQAPAQDAALYHEFTGDNPAVKLVQHKTYDILKIADAALVSSGTATLETALLGVPQVVVYKINPLTYTLAKNLVKVKYISLVNLILDRPAVKELIQDDCTVANVQTALDDILHNNEVISTMKADYDTLKRMLHADHNASELVAETVYRLALKSVQNIL